MHLKKLPPALLILTAPALALAAVPVGTTPAKYACALSYQASSNMVIAERDRLTKEGSAQYETLTVRARHLAFNAVDLLGDAKVDYAAFRTAWVKLADEAKASPAKAKALEKKTKACLKQHKQTMYPPPAAD